MAKKGAAQQLQVELRNDEEFEQYLEKYPKALMVLDVYTEWCGPCLAAVMALRKIKMELGGDDLQLATCKSDNITRLHRFFGKSEPSWLFVREGKSINLMLGSDIPQLIELIIDELKRLSEPLDTIDYREIEELHPEEQKRLQTKTSAKFAIENKERREREKKRRDYLMFCTDAILENLPDVGVTIFGPQVSREMFKKINEPAEALKITCKDKRFQYVTKADFETINFACRDRLPADVIEELTKQELLICFWKISEEAKGTVPQVMQRYVNELTKRVVEPPDDYTPHERVLPPIIAPMKVKVEYEVEPDYECPPDEDDQPKEEEKPKEKEKEKPRASVKPGKVKDEEELFGELEDEGEEEEDIEGAEVKEERLEAAPPMDTPFEFDFGDTTSAQVEEEEDEEVIDQPPPKKYCTKTVWMPPVWTASDERTQAALVYVFFRIQTLPFLQPDPPPEPPHVIMAFDTYKKRDLISIAERNKDEIPCYGFFTSDDAEEAELIANSAQKYAHHVASPNDKIVFKVNKKTSQMMLSLASYGATYVSPNPIIGKEEALKFFPEDYRTAEQDRLEAMEAHRKTTVDEEPAKGKDAKAKKKATIKGKDGKDREKSVKLEPEFEPEGFDMDEFPEQFVQEEDETEADEGYGDEAGVVPAESGEVGKVSEGAEEAAEGEEVPETGVGGEENIAVEEEAEPEPNVAEAVEPTEAPEAE